MGTKVPAFTLTSASGKSVELTKYAKTNKRRNLLLVFYRTGNCGICISYLHDLVANLSSIEGANAAPLAVSLDDAIVQTRTSEKVGAALPLFLDPDAKLVNHFGVLNPADKLSRPAVFLIGPDRRILFRHVGMTLTDRPPIPQLLAELQKHQGRTTASKR